MPVLIMILKAIRAASYLFFAPSPASKKGELNGGDALLIAKDTSAAFGWAALLVLFAKAFGVDLSGEQSQQVVESFMILLPLLTAIVSTIIRWFQDSKPKPLPTPPPNPFPPDGIREPIRFVDPSPDKFYVANPVADPKHVLNAGEPDSQGFTFNDYDFDKRPPGGGPNGPK